MQGQRAAARMVPRSFHPLRSRRCGHRHRYLAHTRLAGRSAKRLPAHRWCRIAGDLFTSTAQQLLLTDTGWGVAVMANTGLVHGHARDIAARIVAVIEGRQVPSVSFWPPVLIDVVMLAFSAVIIALAARGVRRSHIWATRQRDSGYNWRASCHCWRRCWRAARFIEWSGSCIGGATWRGSRCRISIQPSWCCWLPRVSPASQCSALVSPGWRLLVRLIAREMLRLRLFGTEHTYATVGRRLTSTRPLDF